MDPTLWTRRWTRRLRALFQTHAVDAELDEELAFHLDMAAQQNLRQGMTPDEAKRQATLAFGAVRKHREETREARWLSWFPDLSLDVRLGARMLVKYPGITAIGGFAMAFAIWVGCITFEMVNLIVNPSLPLPDGDRIVKIGVMNVQESSEESQILHEYTAWRSALRTVTDLGAYRDQTLNLIARAGDARPIEVAQMSASGFSIVPEPPLLGRTLLADDEHSGAPPVIVLGHEVWQTRFNGDPDVVGRSVQLDEVFATVVGVMPEGFEFPVAHDAWTPLRTDVLEQTPGAGPAVTVFGRLAPEASIEAAQAEVELIGQRMTAELPTTHEHRRPRVVPYTADVMPGDDLLMSIGIPAFAVMLLVLVCSNVALLMFARAATREGELIVRSALGASRRRIVIQMFAEALVLGAVAALVGLVAADIALRQLGAPFLEANVGELPFWFDVRLSPLTVLYAIGLTVLASVIAGVLPALKVTRGISDNLRQAAAGAGGLKFGGVWTAVIITQVAFTTAFPAVLLLEQQLLSRVNNFEAGFPAEQYLAVLIEPEDAAFGSDSQSVAARQAISDRFVPALERLRQRVLSHPEVIGVTFVDMLPRDNHPDRLIQLDEDVATSVARTAQASMDSTEPFRLVQRAYIDAAYFDVLQAPILSGRNFQPSDLIADARVVIVDQGFVDQVMRGRSPVGQRIRYHNPWAEARGEVLPPEPWLEVIGVVKELGMGTPSESGRAAGVYMPIMPGVQGPINMMVHLRSDPLQFISQLRTAATLVDPTLRLSEFKRVDQVTDVLAWVLRLWLKLTAVLSAIALVLSLAGIFAVMSFTVSRRKREIGIRVALGANARQVVLSIFRRPLTQVSLGVAAGAVLGFAFLWRMVSCQDNVCVETGIVSVTNVALLVVYGVFVFGVCLLACVVPTRRALSVQPMEALRAE